MPKVFYKLEKREDENTGVLIDNVIKCHQPVPEGEITEEPICSVLDLEALFATCSKRWGQNWDLNKVCTAITECDFD